MQTLPSLSTPRIQIADDVVNRIPSNTAASAYAQQQQRLEKVGLRRSSTHEKDTGEEDDERDVRKKQVRLR